MLKKLILMFYISIICLIPMPSPDTSVLASTKKEIFINHQQSDCPYPLYSINGEWFIPIEWFSQEMGASDFQWNESILTISLTNPNYFKEHEFLSYLSALEIITSDSLFNERFQNLDLPSYPLQGNDSLMIHQSPIYLKINDGEFSMTFAVYDYVFKDNILYLGSEWLNTVFLADLKESPNTLSFTYLGSHELDEKIKDYATLLTPQTIDETITLWIDGLQDRNGALQYSALSPLLKEQAWLHLQKQGWITGGSSPSLENGTVTNIESISDKEMIYTIKFKERLYSNIYSPKPFTQKITIKQENNTWLIQNIDGKLDYYTILD